MTEIKVFYTNQKLYKDFLLRDDVHEWLTENVPDGYWFISESKYGLADVIPCQIFMFIDTSDALLFKLTWGGHRDALL